MHSRRGYEVFAMKKLYNLAFFCGSTQWAQTQAWRAFSATEAGLFEEAGPEEKADFSGQGML